MQARVNRGQAPARRLHKDPGWSLAGSDPRETTSEAIAYGEATSLPRAPRRTV